MFNLSSFHLFAIVLVFVEAVTDSVVDCVVCIIAYPVYYHMPAVGALPYISAYLFPPKRVYKFIVILYIPVLCLWRVGRKVLISPKGRPALVSSADLDLCLTPGVGVEEEDEEGDGEDSRSTKTANLSAGSLGQGRYRFGKVLPIMSGGRVCWQAATQMCQQVGRCTRLATVLIPKRRGAYGLISWNPICNLRSAWRFMSWSRHRRGTVSAAEGVKSGSEKHHGMWDRRSLPELSGAEDRLCSLYEGRESLGVAEGVDMGKRVSRLGRFGAGRAISWGELVHLSDEKYQNVLKRYNNRWSLYRKIPFKSLSHIWGKLCEWSLPVCLRRPAFTAYIWLFGCSLEDAAERNLRKYRNFSEFFRRLLRPGIRPVNTAFDLTSPADGTVLYCGEVQDGKLEQVKGVTYSLKGFLGPLDDTILSAAKHHRHDGKHANFYVGENSDKVEGSELHDLVKAQRAEFGGAVDIEEVVLEGVVGVQLKERGFEGAGVDEEEVVVDGEDGMEGGGGVEEREEEEMCYVRSLLSNPNNRLYQCVVYLAPGDYHRFHSPANWTVFARRHFPGELFSVNPGVARWLQGLFNFNERALYVGRWRHGFFSMTAVGATNVGSINVSFDKELSTNRVARWSSGSYYDASFTSSSFSSSPSSCAKQCPLSSETAGSKNSGRLCVGERVKKGRLFGDFNLGSTIVLLFEASPNFRFTVEPGQKIKYGQALGGLVSKNKVVLDRSSINGVQSKQKKRRRR